MSATTLGIDLSASPDRTAVCLLSWGDGGARVELMAGGSDRETPMEDGDLLRLIRSADLTGIDAPFGWPEPFVEAVSSWNGLGGWPAAGRSKQLRYRMTDLRITRPRLPLSVSSDLIGVTAMRCASILDALGSEVDRAGMEGPALEVYPAAALFRWGLTAEGYKGPTRRKAREHLVDDLCERLSGVLGISGDQLALCRAGDDNLDALVAALATRARMIGRSTAPQGREEIERARVEGWIHVPDCELGELTG